MGAVCSAGMAKRSEKRDSSSRNTRKFKRRSSFSKTKVDPYTESSTNNHVSKEKQKWNKSVREKSSSKPSTPNRSSTPKRTSFLEKAGGKAAEAFDSIGTNVSKLTSSSVFVKDNKISILAFEVANTITKGANLFHSLSKENLQLLNKDFLESDGVQRLVSTNTKELLSFAGTDKREELNVFSLEVVRFGNQCKNPQWHKLDRFFSRLDFNISSHKQLRMATEPKVQELMSLAQRTGELYQELNAFDRFNQDYQRKVEEIASLNLPPKGEGLTIFRSELKQQNKLVKSLKKKSLWSRNLEEMVEKLVDIVVYLHQAISEFFGHGLSQTNDDSSRSPQRLGAAGLSLHYANIINQINTIATRPTLLPPNMRDTLYHGLPKNVKSALRSRLDTTVVDDKHPVSEVKAQLEKSLEWIMPLATNTIKAHQGFGWVGEWANACNELRNCKAFSNSNQLTRLETLHYADKQKTDRYIVEMLVLLHNYTSAVRGKHLGLKLSPIRTPSARPGIEYKRMPLSASHSNKVEGTQVSQQDRNLLQEVIEHRMTPGVSKSLELAINEKGHKQVWVLSKSTGCSPISDPDERHSFDHKKSATWDILDGV